MIAAALLTLPISAAAAYYSNGTDAVTSAAASTPVAPTPTPAPVSTAVGASAASSQDLTTYVTVQLGKTITVVTQKPKPTSQVPVAAVAPSGADLTTYVTVQLGKTLTITTQKAQSTGVAFVNAAPRAYDAAKVAAVAGAGAAALLL